MTIKSILFFLLVTVSSYQGWCQNKSIGLFDEVYKKELRIENKSLTARIAKFPDDAKQLNNQIKVAIKNGDYKTAFDLGAKMDTIKPNDDDVKNFLGKIASLLGYNEQALSYFDAALKINPSAKWIYINKSTFLSENGKIKMAMETIDSLLKKYPNWFIAYNVQGALYSSSGDKKNALKAYSKAIQLEPKSAQVLTNRGSLYLELNQNAKAKADFERAVAVDPNYKLAVEQLNLLLK